MFEFELLNATATQHRLNGCDEENVKKIFFTLTVLFLSREEKKLKAHRTMMIEESKNVFFCSLVKSSS